MLELCHIIHLKIRINLFVLLEISKRYLQIRLGQEIDYDIEEIKPRHDDSTNSNPLPKENQAEVLKNMRSFETGAEGIREEVKEKVKSNKISRGNQQYLPYIVSEIINLCEELPLWSAVMSLYGSDETTVSRACVESSFNNNKKKSL